MIFLQLIVPWLYGKCSFNFHYGKTLLKFLKDDNKIKFNFIIIIIAPKHWTI